MLLLTGSLKGAELLGNKLSKKEKRSSKSDLQRIRIPKVAPGGILVI